MAIPNQSLPPRQPHPSQSPPILGVATAPRQPCDPAAGVSDPAKTLLPRAASFGFILLLTAALLTACGKKPEAKVTQIPAPTPPSSPALNHAETDLLAALNPAPTAPERPEPTDLEREARRVMNLYPDKNAEELLNTPEVNPKLADALKELAASPQLQAAINQSVDLAAHFKGLDGPPGSFKLGLDTKVYDDARTERMLSAVLTGQARPLVQFLAAELGEASFEFSFTNAEKTSNGITVDRNPDAPAPPASTDPD